VLIVKEAMRLYPPYSVVTRVATTDTVVGKYHLPENGTVALPVMRLHKNKAWFPNPDEFNPDNFVEERASKRHPASYCPFGFGARSCPGERMAWMEIKIFMATFLKHFRVSRSPDAPLKATELDVLLPDSTTATITLEQL
jgi:cytochrome P450